MPELAQTFVNGLLAPVLICVDQALRTADRLGPPSGDELGRFSFEVTLSAWPSP